VLRAPALAAAILGSTAALAADEAPFELHAQATYARQYKPGFAANYSGPNSLRSTPETSYTFTATLYAGLRLGEDSELYFNPEFVQGNPLSGLHGLGGFTNGEAQRGAGPELRGYRARLFLRHTWNLNGAVEEEPSGQNQLRARYAAKRVVVTAGNFSVLDVFDALDYSHDPRTQFMNWSSLTYGAWDFPADARGYTWGVALEYLAPGWQARAGRFLVPRESNGLALDREFASRYGDVAEIALPYGVAGRPAVARALLFRNRVHAGGFEDALSAAAGGGPPDVAHVRRDQSKTGLGVGTQIELGAGLGAFARAGWNDGKTETFMFTEIDRSLAAGITAKGGRWARPEDSAGVAAYANGLSQPHRAYLGAGGLGFFLGDRQLRYASERILEGYYSLNVAGGAWLSLDLQRIANPGYNRDRGPASVLGFRLHGEF